MTQETVTTDYIAKILHCTVEHANLLCRTGRIKAIKPFNRWLVLKEDFEALLSGEVVENEQSRNESREPESNSFDI